jgi:DNA polymerase-1
LESISAFVRNGFIHADILQTAVATGRLAYRNPSLQNLPTQALILPLGLDDTREVIIAPRRAFHALPGHMLLDFDFDQIELRVLAHMSGGRWVFITKRHYQPPRAYRGT